MRNFLFAAMAAVAVYGAGLGWALGQNRYVQVTNNSDFYAIRINIIPSNRNCCWSRDLLETEVIPPKPRDSNANKNKSKKAVDAENFLKINFDDGSGECVFDIRVTTQYPGWEWLFTSVYVCGISEIKLAGDDLASKDGENRWVKVKNESRLTALNVYAIPVKLVKQKDETKSANSKDEICCWSRDLLGTAVIAKGGEQVVQVDDGKGTCTYHIRVTSEKKGIDWYLENVDVCRVESITLRAKSLDDKRRLVEIKNESSVKAVAAFIIPKAKACCWSGNLLREDGIASKKSFRVDVDDASGQCEYEYRIARNDKGREWQGTIDVCSDPSAATLPLITLAE